MKQSERLLAVINQIASDIKGLLQKIANITTPQKYVMTMNAEHATVSKNNFADRTYLMTLGVFGFVHLDFTTTDTPAKFDELGVFPADAPLPTHLVENQTFDGGTVYLGQGKKTKWGGDGRILTGSVLQPNQRYIINMLGFFKHKA
ncbi:MAG: hypothetical protein KGV56_02485 [Gammaproteobacteria bacterium]|nr:hypothetical protein [Gammaproteobacteria bacterium]